MSNLDRRIFAYFGPLFVLDVVAAAIYDYVSHLAAGVIWISICAFVPVAVYLVEHKKEDA